MIEIALNDREKYWRKINQEFEKETDSDAYVWWDDFLIWIKETYRCEYWEREEQYGGPCLIFRDEKDYLFFTMKFE